MLDTATSNTGIIETGTVVPANPFSPEDVSVAVAKEKGIREQMLDIFYREMRWDRNSGKPLPETPHRLGLAHIIPDIWGEAASPSSNLSQTRS